MKKEFQNPGMEYRPIPFWSWNDTIEPDEVRRQIREMADKGMGGYFMHARAGLSLEYLGTQWYECIEAGIEEGKACGLDSWIYDEEGWPSGFAGGKVPEMGEQYQAKFMQLETLEYVNQEDLEHYLAIYQLSLDGTYKRVSTKEVESIETSSMELKAVKRIVQRTYIDVMSKEAVDAFLQVTHEEYYKRFGEDFGKNMKGFFTDEPRFTCNLFGDLPWSDQLTEEYQKRYDASLLDHMICLWQDIGDYKRIRYEFWTMVNDLFVHNYMENIYHWCEEHSCMLTGHIMMEESIFSQMTSTGGVMPCYEYEHIPGIDWLRRRIESPVIAKQVGSVACQLGKKKVLTESFALCGWDLSFEEMKWILEWQYVNGVNMLCQHLEAYSLKGIRKRDYPPSVFYQQSWWEEFGTFTDYVARLGTALGEGNELADVLLIHPMRSGYVCYDGNRNDDMRMLDRSFVEVSEYLSGNHISYHYGDETIIGKYGQVKSGELWIGEVSYKAVILPHMYAVDQRTITLLNEFADQGGTILHTGAFPEFTNGNRLALEILKSNTSFIEMQQLRNKLRNEKLVTASIRNKGKEITSISQQVRSTEDGLLLFLVNHSQEETYQATIEIYEGEYAVELWSLEHGESCDWQYQNTGNTRFLLEFQPMQSYLIHLIKIEEKVLEIEPKNHWEIVSQGRNSMTLDICRFSINDGEWEGTMPVILLMQKLLERQKDSKIELYFDFEIQMDIEQNQEMFLAVEDIQKYQFTLNGKNIDTTSVGWWKDRSFQNVDIKPYIQSGTNTLKLEGVFHQRPFVYEVLYGEGIYETEKNKLTYDMELESMYLVGDFGVVSKSQFRNIDRNAMVTDGPFVIVNAPKELNHSNFTTQGLLFFAEDIVIRQKMEIPKKEGKKVILKYGKPSSPVMKITVNGVEVKTATWAPYEVDITQYCHKGENDITFHLYASNRNLLGPHHHIRGENYGVGPMSFTGEWSWVERESEADGTDYEDRTKNYWQDAYCFVKFGLFGEEVDV